MLHLENTREKLQYASKTVTVLLQGTVQSTLGVPLKFPLYGEWSVQTAFCQKRNGDFKKRKSLFIRSVHRWALLFRRSSKLALSHANFWACAWINSSCSSTIVSTPSCDLSNHPAARVARTDGRFPERLHIIIVNRQNCRATPPKL